ncbi:diguanylate cyclase [Pseudoalteromonas sp. MMG005]|uniref:GGDEF domain-containing response regulator n=1 Tax=Pseudoalteromonas sp. MMG005 TaxID=2822682 RepID=UPI001B3A38F6|nr:diguanylate cyclase [Pseudoalteromonas sp. MMG005]MBQ4846743.1 diguanylate cyclase [Pseudoalteromonas sp. MMG005]
MFQGLNDMDDCWVLVVDDSSLMRQLLVSCLRSVCKVTAVESAEEAIRVCQDSQPDLVLMDWVLEGMSGIEACQTMQDISELSEIPVIFVTSNTSEANQELCWSSGAVDFVPKPIVPKTLQNRVKTHLKYKLQTDLLKKYSFVDGLTGIYNRRFFDMEIVRLLKQTTRLQQPFAAMMIDIDFFKKYNDEYGHLQGDDVLKQVAVTLKNQIKRPIDTVFRYGGEEFIVLLPNTSQNGAKSIANQLVSAIKNLSIINIGSPMEVVTVSVGMTFLAESQRCDTKQLLSRADAALYNAKETGRNKFSILNE